jgi:uncharacterized protein (TIGR03066 family)
MKALHLGLLTSLTLGCAAYAPPTSRPDGAPQATAPATERSPQEPVVGTWEIVDGDDQGTTVTFAADGTLTMTRRVQVSVKQFKESIENRRYAIEGNRLKVSLPDDPDGARLGTIKTWTDQELVLEDERGKPLKLRKQG